jgi:hypothetical protein
VAASGALAMLAAPLVFWNGRFAAVLLAACPLVLLPFSYYLWLVHVVTLAGAIVASFAPRVLATGKPGG